MHHYKAVQKECRIAAAVQPTWYNGMNTWGMLNNGDLMRYVSAYLDGLQPCMGQVHADEGVVDEVHKHRPPCLHRVVAACTYSSLQ